MVFLHVHKSKPTAQAYSHKSVAFLHQVTSCTATLSWEEWAYQYEMAASRTLVHVIPSLLVLFPSENKLQSWSQTVEF